MATYVIGDLQGCFHTLEALLTRIRYKPRADTLWFVGDIVNRGAGSLECLRFVHANCQRVRVVLGNHDLHLVAVAAGMAHAHALDTLGPVLDAPDGPKLIDWLRTCPLLHVEGDHAMVHAGLMPQWSWALAADLAREVGQRLQGREYKSLLKAMYGNEPSIWQGAYTEDERHRFAINTFTRMRALTRGGAHALKYKGTLTDMPPSLVAWFNAPSVRRRQRQLHVGHWSALGLYRTDNVIALDTGCIWGGALTAMRIGDTRVFQEPSREPVSAVWSE